MSKQIQKNFIETTSPFKTIQAWKAAAVEAGLVLEYPEDFPNRITGQLERLKKVNAMGNGELTILALKRQLIHEKDPSGKPITKECLTYKVDLKVTNGKGVPYSYQVEVGSHLKPKVVGQALLSDKVLSGQETVYDIELPKGQEKIKKFINDIVEGTNTYPSEIMCYYKELGPGNVGGKRDGTFTYEDFINSSIEELRDLSARGGGSKNPGYYRDKDGIVRDRSGKKIQTS